MKRILLCLLLLVVCSSAFADDTEKQLKAFLQSREVIDQVYFDNGSEHLSAKARSNLDKLVPRLQQYVKDGHLLRVEGFASPEGDASGNVSLSMKRSIAVRNYLRDSHHLSLELFLTGFGGVEGPVRDKARRVDIAIYRQPAAAMALFDDHGTVESIVLK